MSAPTPAPGDDRPREGYYPDPSIPGYVRYWNGASWVPGTSRPAPKDGEPLTPPLGVRPAAPAVEETGPHFFDEDPQPRSAAGGNAGATPWGADPRVPASAQPAGHADRIGGMAAVPPAEGDARDADGTFILRRPVPGPAAITDDGTPAFRPAPGPDGREGLGAQVDRAADLGTGPAGTAFDGQGAGGQRSGPGAGGGSGFGVPGSGRGAGFAAQGSGAAAPASSATPASSSAAASSSAFPSGSPSAASSAPAVGPGFSAGKAAAARAAAPAPQVAQPTRRQPPQGRRTASAAPPAAGPSVPQQAGPAQTGAPGTPLTSGSGGGQASWAQQVHQLAGGADEPPVAPWKPPVEDPFQAAARRQAEARPARLGKRFTARLIDSLAVGAMTAAAAVPLGARAVDHVQQKIDTARASGRTVTVWLLDGTTGTSIGIVLAVLLLSGALYEVLPTVKWGRTLGKKLCGLQVRDIEAHEPPTFGPALRRWLVYSVPGLLGIGIVGVLWCLFDRPWHQCWHDKAAHTFVAD
ncbi:membrane protein [Streptomyces sp. MUSC 125]|uniref:RDD family protein n=1 Tax=Streptomyces sp. MUSC 125 TaxID=1428624 RepID=UPI00057E7F96|nr:RDD family protein [Streptomyces sp. MUSC 125]KIE23142.1 membrane protein [Streptomyces sp. MUSC 125]